MPEKPRHNSAESAETDPYARRIGRLEEVVEPVFLEMISQASSYSFHPDPTLPPRESGYTIPHPDGRPGGKIFYNPIQITGSEKLGIRPWGRREAMGFLCHEAGHHAPPVKQLEKRLLRDMGDRELLPKPFRGEARKEKRFFSMLWKHMHNPILDIWLERFMGRKPNFVVRHAIDGLYEHIGINSFKSLPKPEQFVQMIVRHPHMQLPRRVMQPVRLPGGKAQEKEMDLADDDVWAAYNRAVDSGAMRTIMDRSTYENYFAADAEKERAIDNKYRAYREILLPEYLKLLEAEQKRREERRRDRKEREKEIEKSGETLLTPNEIRKAVEEAFDDLDARKEQEEQPEQPPAPGRQDEGEARDLQGIEDAFTGGGDEASPRDQPQQGANGNGDENAQETLGHERDGKQPKSRPSGHGHEHGHEHEDAGGRYSEQDIREVVDDTLGKLDDLKQEKKREQNKDEEPHGFSQKEQQQIQKALKEELDKRLGRQGEEPELGEEEMQQLLNQMMDRREDDWDDEEEEGDGRTGKGKPGRSPGKGGELSKEEMEEITEQLLEELEKAGHEGSRTPDKDEEAKLQKLFRDLEKRLGEGTKDKQPMPMEDPGREDPLEALRRQFRELERNARQRERKELAEMHGVDEQSVRVWKEIRERYKREIDGLTASLTEIFVDDRRKRIEYLRREGEIVPGLEFETLAAIISGELDPDTKMRETQNLEFLETEIEFVVDVSGSMSGEKLEQSRDLLVILTDAMGQTRDALVDENLLRPEDEQPLRIGALAFSDHPYRLTKLSDPMDEKKQLQIVQGASKTIGGTEETGAMTEAMQSLKLGKPNVLKFIIIFSDGVGNKAGVAPLVRQIERDKEIILLVAGLGSTQEEASAVAGTYLAPLQGAANENNVFASTFTRAKDALPYIIDFLKREVNKRKDDFR